MTLQVINLGTSPTGDGGDTLRAANVKTNANATELYTLFDRLGLVAGASDWGSFTNSALDDGETSLKVLLESLANNAGATTSIERIASLVAAGTPSPPAEQSDGDTHISIFEDAISFYQAAGGAWPSVATATFNLRSLATNAEAIAGTDTAKPVVSSALAAVLTDRLADAAALTAGTAGKLVDATAYKALDDRLQSLDPDKSLGNLALTFDESADLPAADKGVYYRFAASGTITFQGASVEVHRGDRLACTTDGTAANTPANWEVIPLSPLASSLPAATDAAIRLNTAKRTYPSLDETKLAGIEGNATADQTGAEIQSLLDVETGGTSWRAEVIDDNTMATATATNVPSAESIKAYVDQSAGGATTYNDQSANGYFDIGDMRIQWGRVAQGGSSDASLIFPAPFLDNTFSITGSVNYNSSLSNVSFCVVFDGFQPTRVTYRRRILTNSGPATTLQTFTWIAIGIKP